jgi:pSer/pThr/pTyr-binding forkhead associated (FHA) protein
LIWEQYVLSTEEGYSQTQKISLVFVGQGNHSRILDALNPPTHGLWRVGRASTNDIGFRLLATSKRHAEITVSVDKQATIDCGETVWQWHVLDLNSTNGTYLDTGDNRPYRCAPHVPYRILDKYSVQFGSSAAKVKFDFDVDPTLNGIRRIDDQDDDGGTELGERRELPRKDETSNSPWYVPAILEPGWRWFTGQSTIFQFLTLVLVTIVLIVYFLET